MGACLLSFGEVSLYRPWQRRLADLAMGMLGAGLLSLGVFAQRRNPDEDWYLAVPIALVGAAAGVALWRVGRRFAERRMREEPSLRLVLFYRRLSLVVFPLALALHVWGYFRIGEAASRWLEFGSIAAVLLYVLGPPRSPDAPRWRWIERALSYYMQGFVLLFFGAMLASRWPVVQRLKPWIAGQVWSAVLILFSFYHLTPGDSAARRERCRPVLEAEVARWAAKPWEEVVSELKDESNYQIEAGGVTYQVAVNLLENAEEYVHFLVMVDDGSFRLACLPVSADHILSKTK